MPAIKEEIKITNFALLMISSLSNARSAINIDMVKPIPPKKLTPIMAFQFNSSGSLQIPHFTAINVEPNMP